jgi:hypothetical protein
MQVVDGGTLGKIKYITVIICKVIILYLEFFKIKVIPGCAFAFVFNKLTGRGDADIEAEAGARLTCHLLLRLFKTVECPQPALYSVGQLFECFISAKFFITNKRKNVSEISEKQYSCSGKLIHLTQDRDNGRLL